MKIAFYLGQGIAAPHIVKAAAGACQKLGHEILLVPLTESIQSVETWYKNFKADLIIALDHTGIDDCELHKKKIFYCSWFVDHPLFLIEKENINEHHVALISDPDFREVLTDLGFSKILDCPLACQWETFGIVSNEPEQTTPVIDVCFVGSSPDNLISLKENRYLKLSAEINNFADHAFNILIRGDFSLTLRDAIKQTAHNLSSSVIKEADIRELSRMLFILDKELEAFKKTDLLNSMFPFGINVYGDQRWTESLTNKASYKGAVSYGRPLSKLYRQAKINLVLTRPQIAKGVNQRVFDIPASGGFMLCDYREELKTIFPSLWEKITFRNKEEAFHKIDYYLKYESERKEIARELKKIVVRNHTYEKRMKDLMEKIATMVTIHP